MQKTEMKPETANIFLAVSLCLSPFILLATSMILQQLGYIMNYADFAIYVISAEVLLAISALIFSVRNIWVSRYRVLFTTIAMLSVVFLLMIAYQARDYIA